MNMPYNTDFCDTESRNNLTRYGMKMVCIAYMGIMIGMALAMIGTPHSANMGNWTEIEVLSVVMFSIIPAILGFFAGQEHN